MNGIPNENETNIQVVKIKTEKKNLTDLKRKLVRNEVNEKKEK